jgi:uncharacterized protein DUF6600
MKKALVSLAALVLVLAVPQRAKSADISVDFFYNNLSGGSWVEVGDYGYCWQPDVAVSNTEWRPYADGYWAYTDLGWTWVSYEDFGWATYHYGRWARINDYGWVWVPGRDAELEWGPAWVSWRTGGEYIGWAPLPPETITVVEGRSLTGQIDVEFNIGPAFYNFVDVRYIGEPVLRERIVPVTQNITYVQQTVNVTNITYKNKVVYNYGPDITVVNQRAARPIQRLRLERQENVDVSVAAKSGSLTKVQGDKLVVAAPMRVTKPNRQVAPPAVKTKVESAKLDRGWSAVGDEKAQTEFKQRIKNQDLKKVPPMAAGAGAAGQTNVNPGASPATGASPAGPSTQTGNERDNRRGDQQVAGQATTGNSPAAGAPPTNSASPAAAGTSSEAMGGRGRRQGEGQGQGRNRNRPGQPMEQNAPAGGSPVQATPPPETGSAASSANVGGEEGRGKGRHAERNATGMTPHNEGMAPGASSQPNAASEGAAGQGQGRPGGRRAEGQGVNTGTGGTSESVQGQGARQGRQRGQEGGQNAGPGERRQGQGQEQGQGQGQESRGGNKGRGQASPSPSPQ